MLQVFTFLILAGNWDRLGQLAGEEPPINVCITSTISVTLATMVGDLELVAQTHNIRRNALVQIVRRPVNGRSYDPDSSGEYGLVYTRYLYCPRSDSLLDATNGNILDMRVATADIEARLARYDREDFIANYCSNEMTEEERELADQNDFRHGVAPDRMTSPVSFLNLTTESGSSTLYVEEEEVSDISEILPASSAYDYADAFNSEVVYNQMYTESYFINYAELNVVSEEGEGVNSSWSHVSGTSLLASRLWPRLPPLPSSSTEGARADFDENIKKEPTTPSDWTELMEGSFMASLDCQRSPEVELPGLEVIVPMQPGFASNNAEASRSRVTTRTRTRLPGIPRRRSHSSKKSTSRIPRPLCPNVSSNVSPCRNASAQVNTTVEMISATADEVLDGLGNTEAVNTAVTPEPQPRSQHQQSSHIGTVEMLTVNNGNLEIHGVQQLPLATSQVSEALATTTASATGANIATSSVKAGVPGLKRRRLSSPTSSSSTSSPDGLPRRSRRIRKRRPRRRFAK